MKRGEIWWADLGEPKGSQPGFRRPVVVVQDDLLTDSRLPTVMVVPLTTNLKRRSAIGNLLLDSRETGLTVPSVALICQIMTIDKTLLSDVVGSLGRRTMRKLEAGLMLALGLTVEGRQPP
jgi:mRNA interferase MazF